MKGDRMSRTAGRLAEYKDLFAILASIATIIAMIVAGVWTYRLFIQERTGVPRAKLTQEIVDLPLTVDSSLIHVTVGVENIGHVKIDLGQAYTEVKRIRVPYDSAVWDLVVRKYFKFAGDTVTIEPGETETEDVDIVIPADLNVVTVNSALTLAGVDTMKSPWWYSPTIVRTLHQKHQR